MWELVEKSMQVTSVTGTRHEVAVGLGQQSGRRARC